MSKMEIKGIVEEPRKSLLDLAYEAKNTLRPLRLPDTLGKPVNDKAVMAMDACVNNIWNKMYQSGIACSFPQFLGYGILSNVAQDGLVRSIVETLSDDMTRKGIEFTSEGESDKADQINQLEELMRKYKVMNIFNEAYNKCGYFGGCLVYIDMGYLTDAEKAEPLVLDKDVWTRGKFRGFKVIEPCNVSPGLYNATDPTADEYFNPETWFVLGKTYHKSRFLYFSNNEVPLLLKPAYNFFGIATSQIVLDYIVNFTKNREAAQRLLNKFSLLVYKTNMSDYLSGGECTSLQKRTKITATQRDNDSIVLLDKDMEEFEQINTPIGGVSELVQMSLDLLATIAHRPKTILFGDVPKGLSSNDDGSIRAYYDYVLSQNNKIGRLPMEKVLKIFELEALGDVDNEIGFKFKSLWEMDDKEVAELNSINAQKDVAYITSGVLSPEEVRKSLANNPNSGYSNIDVEDIPEQPEDDMQGEEQTIGDVLRTQMANDEWMTVHPHGKDVKGNPVFVEEGETKKEAIDRRFGKNDDQKELEEFKKNWEETVNLPYKSTKDIEKAFGKSKKVIGIRYDRERYYDAYRNFKEKQDVETMKELKQRFEELKYIYDTLPALEEQRRQEKSKHIDNTEKGAKTAGFEIVKETPKAMLVKKDKKTLWLPRSTIHADGTLTPRGEKLFEHELTDKQKEWAKEQRKIRWKEGVPNNYTCERGKAYAYSLDLLFPVEDTNKSVWVFIPKSVIQENGNIPYWILEKKYDELRDYYRNREQFMITSSPFTTGALQSYDSREDMKFEEELYNKAKGMAFDKALCDDDVTIVNGREVKLKDIDNLDDFLSVPKHTVLDILKEKFRR